MRTAARSYNKALLLAKLALSHPQELSARFETWLERVSDRYRHQEIDYPTDTWAEFVSRWGRWSDESFLEIDGTEFAAQVSDSLRVAASASSINPEHDGDPRLRRLAYAAVRAVRPEVVVESGVAHGVTSAYLLKGLEDNGHGRLVSIDLPPLGPEVDKWVGAAIPPRLRSRWKLVRRRSAEVLPELVSALPPIGLFIHDSLFTRRNTQREFAPIFRSRAANFGLVANCVNKSLVFWEYIDKYSPDFLAIVNAEDKNEKIGLAMWRNPA